MGLVSNLPPGITDIATSLGTPALINAFLNQAQSGFGYGENQAQFDLASQLANQQLGITNEQLGIERGGINRQEQYLPQSEALQKQLLGLSGDELGIQRQQLGLQGKGLDITQAQEQAQADIAKRGAWSGATARGATNTSGFKQGLGDINTNLQNQLAQLALSRQGLGLQGQGLDISGKRLGIEGQQQDISYALQQGSLADQLAQLGVQGRQASLAQQGAIGQAGINQANSDIGLLFGDLGSLTQAGLGAGGFAGQAYGIGGSQPAQAPGVGPGTTPGNVNPYVRQVPAGQGKLQ